MALSAQTQAILLLTAYFSKPVKAAHKPLTTREWGRFAQWLKDHDLNPENLLNGELKSSLNGWTDKSITVERIEQLVNRGSALALAMEKWSRAGLWVLTRSEDAYPRRLKQLLKTDCPPILFGCGDPALLNKGSIAVVGARNANDEDLEFSCKLGETAANQGYSIVSGGARGVDEAAMLGALVAEGTVTGILADSLLKAATSRQYRDYIMQHHLVLISPYYPEAGFNAGNAMSRNKFIYCLADAAVVIQSDTKGGTWNGALENLKEQWVPLWVKNKGDINSGNAQLIKKGGNPLSDDISRLEIKELLETTDNSNTAPQDLFKKTAISDNAANYIPKEAETTTPNHNMDLYDLFLIKLQSSLSGSDKTTDELVKELEIHKTQINIWLKQAVKEKKVKKLNKPVRYQWTGDNPQLDML